MRKPPAALAPIRCRCASLEADLVARRSTAAHPSSLRISHLLLTSGLVVGLAPAAFAQRRMPQIQPIAPQATPLITPATAPASPTALPVQPAPAADAAPTAPVPVPSAATPAPVRLNTGLVTIESDLQRADQTTGVVTATGNVRIVYPDQRVVATARQAQYFSKEGRVVLSGDVDIVQEGGNLMRAEQVVYLVESERLTAIPPQGQQVFSRLRMQQTPQAPPQSGPATTTTPAAQKP